MSTPQAVRPRRVASYGDGRRPVHRGLGVADDGVAYRVRDLRTATQASACYEMYGIGTVGGRSIVAVHVPDAGTEPWVTDGTTAGTTLLGDLHPGGGDSYPAFLGSVPGILFFRASTPGQGHELWATDGTRPGTRLVADISPGPLRFRTRRRSERSVGSSFSARTTACTVSSFGGATDRRKARDSWPTPDPEPSAESGRRRGICPVRQSRSPGLLRRRRRDPRRRALAHRRHRGRHPSLQERGRRRSRRRARRFQKRRRATVFRGLVPRARTRALGIGRHRRGDGAAPRSPPRFRRIGPRHAGAPRRQALLPSRRRRPWRRDVDQRRDGSRNAPRSRHPSGSPGIEPWSYRIRSGRKPRRVRC